MYYILVLWDLFSQTVAPIIAFVAFVRARRLKREVEALTNTVNANQGRVITQLDQLNARIQGQTSLEVHETHKVDQPQNPEEVVVASEDQVDDVKPPASLIEEEEIDDTLEFSPWSGSRPIAASNNEDALHTMHQTSSPAESYQPPKAIVLRSDNFEKLGAWLKINWIYVVAAVSMATAGVFLVDYGVDNGWLSPTARVIGALLFGAALVIGGETVRRRWGDEEGQSTAYLPSVFSGAGVVTLFVAILASLHLYQLTSPAVTLAGLAAVAALAIVLGWYSGPLLAGLGIAGASVAPFLVGGSSAVPELFYLYFGLIVMTGLAIDSLRRWAWVSMLTLACGYGGVMMLYSEIGHSEWLMISIFIFVFMAISIPVLSLYPTHSGARISDNLYRKRPDGWPEFPTRLAAGSMAATIGLIFMVSPENTVTFWLAIALEIGLFLMIAAWAKNAEALEDLALLPALAILFTAAWQGVEYGDVLRVFRSPLSSAEYSLQLEVFILAAVGMAVSGFAYWRGLSETKSSIFWISGSALFAPVLMTTLEDLWKPALVLGAYPWALTVAAVAIQMGLLAGSAARRDVENKLFPSLYAIASLYMITFAFFLLLSGTYLTLAFAVALLAAAVLDGRFDLKPVSWFVSAMTVLLGWRLVADPGIQWALYAPYWEVLLGYGGVIGILIAAAPNLRKRARSQSYMVVESGAWTLVSIFAALSLWKGIDALIGHSATHSHWSMSLMGTIWFISAANQAWRAQAIENMRTVRQALAALFCAASALFYASTLVMPNSPLFSMGEVVHGPILINTLLVAYGLPALIFALSARRLDFLPPNILMALNTFSVVFVVYWVGTAIRHFWQGPRIAGGYVSQYELYTYTLALLVFGAGLLWQAIARNSSLLRRIAMTVIALIVGKVFLIDATGLTGLTRVFAFLALGLSLAGLAYLNRWAASRQSLGEE